RLRVARRLHALDRLRRELTDLAPQRAEQELLARSHARRRDLRVLEGLAEQTPRRAELPALEELVHRLFVRGPDRRAGRLAHLAQSPVRGHRAQAALAPRERATDLRDAVVGVRAPGTRQRGLGGAVRERGDILLVHHALFRGGHTERGFERHAGADVVAERLLREGHDGPERGGLARLRRRERRVPEPRERDRKRTRLTPSDESIAVAF